MPSKLALELTRTEARALLLSGSESRIKVQKFVTIPLESPQDRSGGEETAGKPAEKPPSPERMIVAALAENDISRVETVVVVGRADVELRLLSVPKVPDAELADVVRFQAVQELPGIGEKTPLDYLPLSDTQADSQTQRVLAAVLKPGVMNRVERICEEAKLTPVHLVLRPTATASLMLRQKPELRDACCLLVEILGRQVNFAAVHRGETVFIRQMLLPADPKDSTEAAQTLVAEIRRTRVAVANQEGVEKVDPVALIGADSGHKSLAKQLTDQIGVETLLVDPLPQSTVAKAEGILPGEADACAALLGAGP